MDEPIFKTKKVGRVGPYKTDHSYMERIEKRAKQFRDAKSKKQEEAEVDESKQLTLPGM